MFVASPLFVNGEIVELLIGLVEPRAFFRGRGGGVRLVTGRKRQEQQDGEAEHYAIVMKKGRPRKADDPSWFESTKLTWLR